MSCFNEVKEVVESFDESRNELLYVIKIHHGNNADSFESALCEAFEKIRDGYSAGFDDGEDENGQEYGYIFESAGWK